MEIIILVVVGAGGMWLMQNIVWPKVKDKVAVWVGK